MIKTLIFSILFMSPLITNAQKITYDTLWSISPRVSISGSKDIESKSHYTFETNGNIRFEFHFNYLFFKRKQVSHSSYIFSSRSIKRNQDKYKKKIQQGVNIEKADSFILYRLIKFAGSYHTDDFFNSWGGYEEVSKFDKLQGKYHYMDFHSAYKKKVPIYRKNDWKRDTEDSIYVYECTIERYLLVDSVIYLFTSALRKNHRNRKRGLRILEREFKEFVRCIWVKEEEEEDSIEK